MASEPWQGDIADLDRLERDPENGTCHVWVKGTRIRALFVADQTERMSWGGVLYALGITTEDIRQCLELKIRWRAHFEEVNAA